MEMAQAYDEVVALVRRAPDATSAWERFTDYISRTAGGSFGGLLKSVLIEEDVAKVSAQLGTVFNAEPPPETVNAYYFGLFDAVDKAGERTIGYYVAGVVGYDPDDGDSLCSPAWWPQGRYLHSAALAAVKEAEEAASLAGEDLSAQLLSYAGQLGAAMIVSRFAIGPFVGDRVVVVGFDSGDVAEIGT